MIGKDCSYVNVTMINSGTELISWVKECMYFGVKLLAVRGFFNGYLKL